MGVEVSPPRREMADGRVGNVVNGKKKVKIFLEGWLCGTPFIANCGRWL